MEYVQTLYQQLLKMEWRDYLDIILVAILLYKVLPMIRSSGAARVAVVIAAVLVISWITGELKLHTLNFLISELLDVGLIAVVILFQPELRRMLDHISNLRVKKLFNVEKQKDLDPMITQVVMACDLMSQERVGALIVFERNIRLDDYMKTGTAIDGQVSEQLLRNIFFPKAALHDGAMIVRDGRVAAAGCVLPLSDSKRLSADLGTRHRAGVGMSEASDAVVVIVSEETGAISVAVAGMLKRHLAPQTLDRLLRNELCKNEEQKEENLVLRLRQKLLKDGKEDGSHAKK